MSTHPCIDRVRAAFNDDFEKARSEYLAACPHCTMLFDSVFGNVNLNGLTVRGAMRFYPCQRKPAETKP